MTTEEAKKAGFRIDANGWATTWRILKTEKIRRLYSKVSGLDSKDFPTRAKAREALRKRKENEEVNRKSRFIDNFVQPMQEHLSSKSKADAEHTKWLADMQSQTAPITPEQAKMLRDGDSFYMLDPISLDGIAKVTWVHIEEARKVDAIGCYFTRAAAQAAIDKAKDKAKHKPCDMPDEITFNGAEYRRLADNEQHKDGDIPVDGSQTHRFGSIWYRPVASHETPVGETQRSPAKPLSDAEFKRLVGRMSLPQLYDALKANGVKLEGIGLEPKNVDEQSVLEEAARCVTGPRRRDYGTPDENFGLISSLWSVQLKHEVTPMQVAMCLILLKIARQANSPKRDNLVDIAGYAQCASELKGAK